MFFTVLLATAAEPDWRASMIAVSLVILFRRNVGVEKVEVVSTRSAAITNILAFLLGV